MTSARKDGRTRVALVAFHNPNIYPAFYSVASSLSKEGMRVCFMSRDAIVDVGEKSEEVEWKQIPLAVGIGSKLPWVRTSNSAIVKSLIDFDPDIIISQHEFLVPSLLFKIFKKRQIKLVSYFLDYEGHRRYMNVVKILAGYINGHVDVCDIRLGWRKRDWPRLNGRTFVVRQAPQARKNVELKSHSGAARVVFTSSKYVLRLDRNRLSRFIHRVCCNGVSIDWYMPEVHAIRAEASALVNHPLFNVHEPIEKSRLIETLSQYDVGLHWAPMAEKEHDSNYFQSAASNKIGEYLSAGLVIAHAGNPGLAYLPPAVCSVFDPTDPELGADSLATSLVNREAVERKREAALHFHLDKMNFESQAEPFIRFILSCSAPKTG